MWPGAAGPCYCGSRCFIGISVGLALVEGLPAAAGATWVPDRSVWAPSVERGGGENGWADGLTGGALRAGLEPPAKTPGEICCLEQCRSDAESPGPFSSGVGQRCRGGPRSNGEHDLHQQGLPPGVDCGGGRGYRRCWADPMAGLANASTRGLTSRRGHGGRCGGGGVRSGRRRWSPWGLAGAFSGLEIVFAPQRRSHSGSHHPALRLGSLAEFKADGRGAGDALGLDRCLLQSRVPLQVS